MENCGKATIDHPVSEDGKSPEHSNIAMNACSWENHLAFSPRRASDFDDCFGEAETTRPSLT